MTSVSDWTILFWRCIQHILFADIFHFSYHGVCIYFVSHVPPPHPFIFIFISIFEFFDFDYFSGNFSPWKTEQGGALTGPPLVSKQGGVCHPLYGFFLLPGHLRGSIEHCS